MEELKATDKVTVDSIDKMMASKPTDCTHQKAYLLNRKQRRAIKTKETDIAYCPSCKCWLKRVDDGK